MTPAPTDPAPAAAPPAPVAGTALLVEAIEVLEAMVATDPEYLTISAIQRNVKWAREVIAKAKAAPPAPVGDGPRQSFEKHYGRAFDLTRDPWL